MLWLEDPTQPVSLQPESADWNTVAQQNNARIESEDSSFKEKKSKVMDPQNKVYKVFESLNKLGRPTKAIFAKSGSEVDWGAFELVDEVFVDGEDVLRDVRH